MPSPPLERVIAKRDADDDGVRVHHPSGQAEPALPGSLTGDLLEAALGLGFSAAATTHVEPMPEEEADLEGFLESGRAGEMAYLGDRLPNGRLARAVPAHLLADARTALVVTLPYRLDRGGRPGPLAGRVAAYAGGTDYHHVVKERLLVLADILADLTTGPVLARAVVDTAPLLERQLLRRSGLAFLGKNTLAIAPGAGSTFHIGVLLLTVELPHERRVRLGLRAEPATGCGSCTACIEACPTQALEGAHRIDPRRCISYLTIEHEGPIPEELRSRIGSWVFGCDACQTSCPFNASSKSPPGDPELTASGFWKEAPLASLLALSSSGYRKVATRTAMRRVGREQLARNAAVALGNGGEPRAVALLADVLEAHFSPLVQEHAVWALGELARVHEIGEAREALLAARPSVSEALQTAIDRALARTDSEKARRAPPES